MRFPRNLRIFRGQLDPAPFASVFFLLLIFLLLNSSLVFIPGARIDLPEAVNLPGTTNRTIVVAVDAAGQFYFQSQVIGSVQLSNQLAQAVGQSKEPLTLIIQASKNVRYEVLLELGLLARQLGIREALLATRPPPMPAAVPSKL